MSEFPQRKSPRLNGYDYAQEGIYFVTVCVQDRLSLFGSVKAGEMMLNPAGKTMAYWWQRLPTKFDDIDLDLFVIMPNHFHGLVIINRFDADDNAKTSLPNVMNWFKAMTTNAYIRGVKTNSWKRFRGKLWQRSYHDHIVRNEIDLNRLREYVLNNPARWEQDTFYES